MSSDIVDEVQGIDKFSENRLLKNIELSDKVAINLKLKKNQINFSGDIAYEGAYDERYNSSVNVLTISKAIKNFSTLSINNIGIEKSPSDFFKERNSNNNKLKYFFDRKLNSKISLSNSPLEFERLNINNSLFLSINQNIKLSKKSSLRISSHYLKDNFFHQTEEQNKFNILNDGFTVFSNLKSNEKPKNINLETKYILDISENSLFDFTFFLTNNNMKKNNHIINENEIKSLEIFNNMQFEGDFNWTKKINTSNALQLNLNLVHNSFWKNFELYPAFNFETGIPIEGLTNYQYFNSKKNSSSISASWLGNNFFKNKFKIITEFNLLNSNNEYQLSVDKNKLNSWKYNLIETKFSAEYNYNVSSNLSIKSNISFQKNFQKYFYPNFQNFLKGSFLLYSISSIYRITDKLKINASYSFDKKYLGEDFLNNQYILTDYRNIERYDDSYLKFQNIHNLSFGYTYYNFDNQFNNHLIAYLNIKKNNLISNIEVNNNFTITDYLLSNIDTKLLGINFLIEKFIPILESTISLKSDLKFGNYFNFLNNSFLRKNKLKLFETELKINTALNFPINFQNSFFLNNRVIETEDSTINNMWIKNTFHVIYKISNNFVIQPSWSLYFYNLNNNNSQSFIDLYSFYKTNFNWEFLIRVKNLTNNIYSNEKMIEDYYERNNKTLLNKRYFLLGINYKF